MKRFLITALFGTLVTSSFAVRADDDDHNKHRERTQDPRYYDNSARDYHTWNDDEQRAWNRYLNENHREYRDFDRADRRERERYFKWRHEHHDDHDRDRDDRR